MKRTEIVSSMKSGFKKALAQAVKFFKWCISQKIERWADLIKDIAIIAVTFRDFLCDLYRSARLRANLNQASKIAGIELKHDLSSIVGFHYNYIIITLKYSGVLFIL
jgi:hypothetical protein